MRNNIDDEDDLLDFDEEVASELTMEAGMLGGVQAYNEVRGYDNYEPEECGHHCSNDCPRCGDDR